MAIEKTLPIVFKVLWFKVISEGEEANNVSGEWIARINGHAITRDVFGFGAADVLPLFGKLTDGTSKLGDAHERAIEILLENSGAFDFKIAP